MTDATADRTPMRDAQPSAREKDTGQPAKPLWRRWLGPGLAVFGIGLAATLLYATLHRYSAEQLWSSIRAVPAGRLALAGLFAAASYACLTGFDALGIRYLGKRVPYPKVALASFTSLSLGHSIGLAGVSSGAIRYRFYLRWGLNAEEVTKLVLFCGVTVGLGLMGLGGLVLAVDPTLAAELLRLPEGTIRAISGGLIALALAYPLLCWRVRGTARIWRWRVSLPSAPIAAGQVLVGTVNFGFVAACLQQTLAGIGEAAYLDVASAYVLANVATLITHVPGGLGVIEAVVTHLIPGAGVVGAVLVFRIVYFLVPLGIGGLLFALSEMFFDDRAPDDRRSPRALGGT